jgi:hypothetical protein
MEGSGTLYFFMICLYLQAGESWAHQSEDGRVAINRDTLKHEEGDAILRRTFKECLNHHCGKSYHYILRCCDRYRYRTHFSCIVGTRYGTVRGASEIKFKKANKKRTVTVRRVISLFSIFFALIFYTFTLAAMFVFARFLPKVSKVKERGCKLNFGLRKW